VRLARIYQLCKIFKKIGAVLRSPKVSTDLGIGVGRRCTAVLNVAMGSVKYRESKK
jgi:hypothetical protein